MPDILTPPTPGSDRTLRPSTWDAEGYLHDHPLTPPRTQQGCQGCDQRARDEVPS